MTYLKAFVPYGEGWHGGHPDYRFYDLYFGEHGFMKANADDIELMQYTGQDDSAVKPIYEGDILRATIEEEFGDINHYFIVTWINEWSIFAALSHDEYPNYLTKGAEALDESMFWTFNIENGNTHTVCANIYEHPDYIQKCMIEEDNSMNELLKP